MAENSEPWKWEENSIHHYEKFMKLIEYGKKDTQKVKDIHGVRVCCLPDFCIGQGSDGTRVFVGLGSDGYERAVKRLHKDACTDLAEIEKNILNKPNIKRAKNVVRYYSLDDQSDDEYVFLILDLCEETLESFVKKESLDRLVKTAPNIISHILKGLADLHRNQPSILHRDVRPSNILRNVRDEWLLADFGVSRVLPLGKYTYNTHPIGATYWRAVESYSKGGRGCKDEQVRYKKESDIQLAGMVAYYIVTKGQHPFGEETDRLRNLLHGKPVGLDSVSDPALKDFLSWMLSHDPNDRPSAEEALNHPYLQTAEEKFEMLCKVGNEVEIKKGDVNSDVVRQLNLDSTDWRTMIKPDVLQYLCTDFLTGRRCGYRSSWTECLRLIRNVNQHWKDTPRPLPQPEAFYEVGDPEEYFLKVFPSLPVVVHRIVRSSDWKERPQLRQYFRSQGCIPELERCAPTRAAFVHEETDKECEETSGNDALYTSVNEVLMQLLNDNCEWSDLEKAVEKAQTNHNKVEVRLICLSKMIEYCSRKGDHTTAEEKLNEYHATLPTCTPSELDVFEVTEQYLRCLVERSKGNYEKSYETATKSLRKADKIRPAIVSTEFYVLAATVLNILATKTEDASERNILLSKAKEFFNKAQRHLPHVRASKLAKADLEQKLYTNLAMFHAGSCLAGYKLTDSHASVVDETEAKENLDEINYLITYEYVPFSRYRTTQHHLAQSDLRYLASKSRRIRKKDLLKQALRFAEQALNLAEVGNFPEMVHYAQVRVAAIKEKTDPWKYEPRSLIHHEKFENLLEYEQEKPEEVMEINGVRVCCLPEFCIGMGNNGTRVYVGLGKDGYERAVKRLPKDACHSLAEDERQILNEPNIIHSNNVVRYWSFNDTSEKNYVFLILDLCEETLESYVDRVRLDHLQTIAPEIIRQVLKGLADLHRNPTPVLHRDLKPSNILRNVHGEWLLADFGISRVLTIGALTHKSVQRGSVHWRAVETYGESEDYEVVRYKKESDIQVAGMVAYYVVTKGQHPYGKEIDRRRNLRDGNPVGLDSLLDPGLKDLLSWMLSHDPYDRPLAEEALKHPYLQTAEEKFEMLCKVGNEVEIKTGDVNSDVVRLLNSDSTDWRTMMRTDVLQYLCTDYLTGRTTKYGSSWTECLRLMRNVNLNWKNRQGPLSQPEAFYLVGDPQEYFLKVFPNLPVVVHRIVRWSDGKRRPGLQKYFNSANAMARRTANVGNFSEDERDAQTRVAVKQEETGPTSEKPMGETLLSRGDSSSVKKSSEPWKWEMNSLIHREVKKSSEPWKWEMNSLIHREKFTKLLKYGQENPEEVKEIDGVRFCCLPEFLIGQGSRGTLVYVGVTNDGCERAVKRLQKTDASASLAEQEQEFLYQPNAIRSNHVVRYFSSNDKGKEYAFVILSLCEETLESYVKDTNNLDNLVKDAPIIISHILKGLADLHGNQPPVVHRDVKPTNILRNVHGEWMLADFGISRVLPQPGTFTDATDPSGTPYWIAAESYVEEDESKDDKAQYKTKSDIQVAGMVAYYVVTKRKHPFGKRADRLRNLLDGNPVGLDSLSDPTLKDLLSWMLSHDPNDRPSAEEALKHPYLQTAEEKFEMLCKVGNEVEIQKGDVNSQVVRLLNSDSTDWKTMITPDVLQYLCTDFFTGRRCRYRSSWTECLRLMRNVNQHWKDMPRPSPQPEAFYEVGDPQEYFLKVFPNLPVVVHRIVRSSDWKERPELQKYFR